MEKKSKLLEKYYYEFRQPLYWFVRKKVNNDEVAQDIVSDVFMKLLEHEDILKREASGVRAWLYTVARNTVIDMYRKKSNNVEKVDIDEEIFEIIAVDKTDYLQKEIRDEKYHLILAAMEGLDPGEKEMVTLRFNDELSFKEIAQIVGKEEGAVKMSVYRAVEKIKEKVEYERNS